MSYCRWSGDDYRCDVYVYADVDGGWTTHVAGRRHTLTDAQLPPPVDLPHPFTDEQFQAWYQRGREVSRLLDDVEYADINLPHAGETFSDPAPEYCADRLEDLRALGYRVPQDAIDALREEAAYVPDRCLYHERCAP